MQLLRTKRLVLRPYQLDLQNAFLAWMEDASIETFLSRSFPDMPRGEHLLDCLVHRCSTAQPEARVWAVTGGPDGDLVAHIECKATAKTSDGQLELIYAVRRGREGRGIATEAVKSVSSELVSTGVDVVAYINPVNEASRRVLQKTSFVQHAAAEIGHGERWILVHQRAAPA
jgi:RimJ/RimL family protein N-acetyltransferase